SNLSTWRSKKSQWSHILKRERERETQSRIERVPQTRERERERKKESHQMNPNQQQNLKLSCRIRNAVIAYTLRVSYKRNKATLKEKISQTGGVGQ
ncbi:hypothetical protein M5D96_003245, partial [Drosophila gunungcola]